MCAPTIGESNHNVIRQLSSHLTKTRDNDVGIGSRLRWISARQFAIGAGELRVVTKSCSERSVRETQTLTQAGCGCHDAMPEPEAADRDPSDTLK